MQSIDDQSQNDLLAEIESLKSQLQQTRENMLSLMPESIQRLLESYYLADIEEGFQEWYEKTVTKLASSPTPEFDAVLESHTGYAPCPLCGDVSSSPYQFGFTLPEGLRRHLTGVGMAKECIVMNAAKELAKEYFKKAAYYDEARQSL